MKCLTVCITNKLSNSREMERRRLTTTEIFSTQWLSKVSLQQSLFKWMWDLYQPTQLRKVSSQRGLLSFTPQFTPNISPFITRLINQLKIMQQEPIHLTKWLISKTMEWDLKQQTVDEVKKLISQELLTKDYQRRKGKEKQKIWKSNWTRRKRKERRLKKRLRS